MHDCESPKVCSIRIAGANNFVGRCIGAACAWWLSCADACAVPTIAGVLIDRDICKTIFCKKMEG